MAPSSNSTRSAPRIPVLPTLACMSFRAASTTRSTTRPRWPGRSGAAALAAECLDCPVMEICGGGLYPHRYRQGSGFRNPSVYCADLLQLITHVRDRVFEDLRWLGSAYTSSARSPRSAGSISLPPAPRDAPASASRSYLRSTSARRRSSARPPSPAALSSTARLASAISVSG